MIHDPEDQIEPVAMPQEQEVVNNDFVIVEVKSFGDNGSVEC